MSASVKTPFLVLSARILTDASIDLFPRESAGQVDSDASHHCKRTGQLEYRSYSPYCIPSRYALAALGSFPSKPSCSRCRRQDGSGGFVPWALNQSDDDFARHFVIIYARFTGA